MTSATRLLPGRPNAVEALIETAIRSFFSDGSYPRHDDRAEDRPARRGISEPILYRHLVASKGGTCTLRRARPRV